MVNFIFQEDNEDEDTDEETLDLSFLSEADEDEGTEDSVPSHNDRESEGSLGVSSASGFTFEVEESIPPAARLTDSKVKEKAKRGRKKSPAKMDYAGKRELGWSLFCAHKDHLPTLCEKDQTDGKVTCTCQCHEARGFKLPEPDDVSGSDDEEILLLID